MRNGRQTAPAVLRALARLVLHGADGERVRLDLEEAYERDLDRGMGGLAAARRYVANALASSVSVAAARVRRRVGRRPGVSISWLDVKLGSRMLLKHPALTAVSVFALAIGIPVGLAPGWMMEAIESDFPVAEGDRIVAVRFWDEARSLPELPTWFDYTSWRGELGSFESLGAVRVSGYNVAFDGTTGAPVPGAEVTASTFEILRSRALHGRVLFESDESVGAPLAVLIGEDLWRGRFGGTADIVGREIRIGGVPHTVVGVMASAFRFPMSQQLWLPLRERPAAGPGSGGQVYVLGRLADGVTRGDAQAELTAAGLRVAAAFPEAYERLRPEVVKSALMFLSFRRGGARADPLYWMTQALSLVLLVVACVNVALLIFARTATRSSELAVRTALGASRARIVSQVFTECLVLALAAAGMGLLLLGMAPRIATFVVEAISDVTLPANPLPYWMDFGLSSETVISALALAAVSAAVAGVIPALKVTGSSVRRNIERAQAGRSGVRFGGVSSALVAIDVAIAVGVIGFGVAVVDHLGDAWTAQTETVGFADEEYLSAQVALPVIGSGATSAAADDTDFERRFGAFQQALASRLEAEPGVRGVVYADNLPRMEHPTRRIELDGDDAAAAGTVRFAKVATVDIGFFDVLGTPLLDGRGFNAGDIGENASAVLVNESFVEDVLGGTNPIGRRVRYRLRRDSEPSRWYEIVGVVGRAGMNIMQPDFDAGMYLPMRPGTVHPVRLAIHAGADPASFTPRLRQIVADIDPEVLVASPVALDRVYEGDWYIGVAATFGGMIGVGILLGLAACGIYAIMSFTVAERTREIGIRTALGARPGDVAWTVARRSLMQLAIGGAAGTPVAFWAFSGMREQSLTLAGFAAALMPAIAIVLLVGLVACTAPTVRALRVEPSIALKE